MVLKLRVEAPGGWKGAKCLGVKTADTGEDYDPFFDDDSVDDAKSFCNGTDDGVVCPIRQECLLFALTNNEKSGVWGGMDELGRRGLRKRWPLKGKEPRPEWHWMETDEALDGLDLKELLEESSSEDD